MSETPRTDAVHAKNVKSKYPARTGLEDYVAMMEHAQALEREHAALSAELAALRTKLEEAQRKLSDARREGMEEAAKAAGPLYLNKWQDAYDEAFDKGIEALEEAIRAKLGEQK